MSQSVKQRRLPRRYWRMAMHSIIAVGAFWLYSVSQRRAASAPLPLRAELVAPTLSEDGYCIVESNQTLEVTWRIENRSKASISGFDPKTGCSCHIVKSLPPELLPGQSADLTLRLPVPASGTMRREIPVMARQFKTPVVILILPIRVRVTPPTWLQPPTMISMSGLAGEPFHHETIFEAVEHVDSKNWVQRVRTDPEEFAEVSLNVEQRGYGEDPAICLRRYRIGFQTTREIEREIRGQLHLIGESETVLVAAVPCSLKLLPPLAVIPEQLRFRGATMDQDSTQVTIVSRLSSPISISPQFDMNLVEVSATETTNPNVLRYQIRPTAALKNAGVTDVVFAAEGIKPVILKVNFELE